MAENVLIVDSNEAFATMLEEGLVAEGKYETEVVSSGEEALVAVRNDAYDMVVIDVDLPDMTATALVEALREVKPDQRIMLIPLFGEELDDEAGALDVQGVLPKPFFRGELVPRLQEALTKPVGSPARRAPPAGGHARVGEGEIPPHLADLCQEIKAEAALLIGPGGMIAHAGALREEAARELATLVAEGFAATEKAAQFLGEHVFEQSLHEGEGCHLYCMRVGQRFLLAVALLSSTPAGMVRLHTRRTAETVLQILS